MSAALLPLLLWSVIGCLVFYSLYLLYGFYLDAQKKSEKLAKIVGQAPHPLWGNVHVVRTNDNYFNISMNVIHFVRRLDFAMKLEQINHSESNS